jgi:hypothetical protein
VNSTKYYWRVRAKNASGSTSFTAPWSFTTAGVAPAPVSLVSPAHGSTLASTTQQFTWHRGTPSVTRYWFEIAMDSLFATRQPDSTLTDTSKTMLTLLNNTTYWWRVRAGNTEGWGAFSETRRFRVSVTDVQHEKSIPTSYALEQNYPNPFNPSTLITFSIPRETHVRLEVFSLLGNSIATLVDERLGAGRYSVTFDAGKVSEHATLSSGPYIYRLNAGGTVIARKMAFVK